MNIVITLPTELIAEILEGRKQIEIRKSQPKYFDIERDSVFVVMKKTTSVPISFTISKIEEVSDKETAWCRFKNKFRIPYAWFKRYTDPSEVIYLWHIHSVIYYWPHIMMEDDLLIKRAPQQYCYTPIHADYFAGRYKRMRFNLPSEESSEST